MRALLLRIETWVMLALGFSAGLPILLVYGTISTWLKEAGVDVKVIGWFSLVGLAYGFKFLWAPLIDRIPCPVLSRLLGHRRGWLLAAQFLLMFSLLLMGWLDPTPDDIATEISQSFVIGAILIAIASATQDIVIDAVRVELAEPSLQAWLSGVYVAGYRVGMIVAGAGALYLATELGSTRDAYDLTAWQSTYRVMALFTLVGIITTMLCKEPKFAIERSPNPTLDYAVVFGVFGLCLATFFVLYTGVMLTNTEQLKDSFIQNTTTKFERNAMDVALGTYRFFGACLFSVLVGYLSSKLLQVFRPGAGTLIKGAFVEPFSDLATRFGRATVIILLVIGTYRLTDVLMGVLANPFYLEVGFSKTDIATVTKVFGLIMTIVGGFFGGWLTKKKGIYYGMLLGGLLSATTNLLFSWLAARGPELSGLYFAIGVDNLAGGMAATAFVAFLSKLTNREFTATQYASLFALTAIFPKLIAAKSGEGWW